MDITEFFQQSVGKWFSQRTSHNLTLNQSESGKSDIYIELLERDNPTVINLCEQCQVDPTLALLGARVTWEGTVESQPQKYSGATMLVPLANAEQPNQGQLLRQQSQSGEASIGHYVIGTDESLTLITEDASGRVEDRIWFASPNLRLRTSVIKQADGFSMASFCSEIRMGVTKPANA